jgi:hypothetical protein
MPLDEIYTFWIYEKTLIRSVKVDIRRMTADTFISFRKCAEYTNNKIN